MTIHKNSKYNISLIARSLGKSKEKVERNFDKYAARFNKRELAKKEQKKEQKREKLKNSSASRIAAKWRERIARKERRNLIEDIELALIPKPSSYQSYQRYEVPARFSHKLTHANFSEMTRLQNAGFSDATPESIDQDTFVSWLQGLQTHFTSRIMNSAFHHYQNVKAYVVIEFLCWNTQSNSKVNLLTNLGGDRFTDKEHFMNDLTERALEVFTRLAQKDYMIVYGIGKVDINVYESTLLGVFSGSSYTELPPEIKNRKAVINIKNNDKRCFLYSCMVSRFPDVKNPQEMRHYKNQGDWVYNEQDGMRTDRIHHFEAANKVNINVYTWEPKKKLIVPVYLSKKRYAPEKTISLFLWDGHYSFIKNWSRFCGADGVFHCPNCLQQYRNRACYKKHCEICHTLNENGSNVVMPKLLPDGSIPKTRFSKYCALKRLPVVLYCDTESTLEKCSVEGKSYVTTKHVTNSFRIQVESDVDLGSIPLQYEYVGPDADVEFIKQVTKLDTRISAKLKKLSEEHAKHDLTDKEELEFQNATECIFCKKTILDTDTKVRDHCHFSGNYCGAAHQQCNVKVQQTKKGQITIPCIFHNANYDIKGFMQAFKKIQGSDYIKNMSGVPCNMEIYKTIKFNNIQIIDSYAHLSSSLDSLIKNLPENKKVLLNKITTDPEKIKLINKKGYYPYELISDISMLDISITELKKEHFDSKLCLSSIDNEGWEHVQKVIKAFGITTFRQYHDLYLKIDVYGLRDVFEYYRDLSITNHGLDPCHFLGLPAYTWEAGLKFTGVELDQLTDNNMLLMFEKMKRGGISTISKRYLKANNHYLPDFNKDKEKSFLLQVDANNLYGWAMIQSLPKSDFQWYNDIKEQEIWDYNENSDIGYIVECDLEYPDSLHDEHNDYPLAPEHKKIDKTTKLVPNLENKTNYITHVRNLQYYLKHGMVLKKIHRAISFKQEAWLKPYIDLNSRKRTQAKNAFEKDYYKLLNNAFYGKTMENVRDRVNVQFCTNEQSFQKWVNSPLFAYNTTDMGHDLHLVKTHQKVIVMNKPLYIGACVMDLSKLVMYEFHYDVMKKIYPTANMAKTDTDSLLYEIFTDDLYADMKNNEQLQKYIEFSNYPKDHPLFNEDRKKAVGIFQDECVDGEMAVISEYIGLRAKSYANKIYYPADDCYQTKKKSKGVAVRHLKKRIGFEDYEDCLFRDKKVILGKRKLDDIDTKEHHKENIYSFRSFNMVLYSVEISKICLSSNDDKRVICEDKINTFAYGHCKIRK